MKHKFSIFADYFQFYLEDENTETDTSVIWTEQTVNDLLAVSPGFVAIGTVRNMEVPVEVEVIASEPTENLEQWDHVTECSVSVSSKRLAIFGCTDYREDAVRIEIKPGNYRVRVYYGDLDTLSLNGLDGDDHYKIVIWPGEDLPTCVVKRAKYTRR
jgi:hypothetical protein